MEFFPKKPLVIYSAEQNLCETSLNAISDAINDGTQGIEIKISIIKDNKKNKYSVVELETVIILLSSIVKKCEDKDENKNCSPKSLIIKLEHPVLNLGGMSEHIWSKETQLRACETQEYFFANISCSKISREHNTFAKKSPKE